MMFIRIFTLLPIVALVAVATAVPGGLEARQTDNECDTGSLQCCTNTYVKSDPTLTTLLGLLGVVLPNVSGLVGLGCTPITVVGTGSGASCTQQPACCFGNTYNGLINFGCSPVNLGL